MVTPPVGTVEAVASGLDPLAFRRLATVRIDPLPSVDVIDNMKGATGESAPRSGLRWNVSNGRRAASRVLAFEYGIIGLNPS
jgi:hypothetical protein